MEYRWRPWQATRPCSWFCHCNLHVWPEYSPHLFTKDAFNAWNNISLFHNLVQLDKHPHVLQKPFLKQIHKSTDLIAVHFTDVCSGGSAIQGAQGKRAAFSREVLSMPATRCCVWWACLEPLSSILKMYRSFHAAANMKDVEGRPKLWLHGMHRTLLVLVQVSEVSVKYQSIHGHEWC